MNRRAFLQTVLSAATAAVVIPRVETFEMFLYGSLTIPAGGCTYAAQLGALRMVLAYAIDNDIELTRFDVLYGLSTQPSGILSAGALGAL